MKNVFILGGTGLLGYHTTLQLLEKGYKVSTVSLPPLPEENLFPNDVSISLGNINEMSDEEVINLLTGMDYFIYAAGADERIVPNAPSAKFFYEANVIPTQRLARLSRIAKVKKFLIYGSYFSHFAEIWTDLELTKQGYPRTRLLQEEIAMLEGEGEMDVMSLRLPYIFGTMPGRVPLWDMFLPQIENKQNVSVLQGGTAMVTCKQVGQATIGALENGRHGDKYTLCDTNMTHKEFYEIINEVLGQTDTIITTIPLEKELEVTTLYDAHTASLNKEHGIHLSVSSKIKDRFAYIDPNEYIHILNYEKDDVRAAIRESIQACLDARKTVDVTSVLTN